LLTRTIRVPLFFDRASAHQGERMSVEPYDVLMAAAQGRRAIRRGELAVAERWFKLAERAAAIAQRLSAVARSEAQANWRPPRNPV
jgi:hypothetical protein